MTKPKEKECLHYESLFDYESLIDECIKGDQIIKLSYTDREDEGLF